MEDRVSYEIRAVNIHENNNNEFELWVTKTDGKNKLLKTSKNLAEIVEIKEAVDYSIKIGDKVLELK